MGAGAWGCAICGVLADAGNSVTLWAREPEVADEINACHRNTRFAPGMQLSAAIRATSDPVHRRSRHTGEPLQGHRDRHLVALVQRVPDDGLFQSSSAAIANSRS